MKGVAEKIGVEKGEEVEKEKKKRRRSNRRSKQNSTVSGTSCSNVDAIHGEALESLGNITMSTGSSSSQKYGLDVHASTDQGLSKASNVAFNSLPIMHINGEVENYRNPSYLEGTIFSKSCPEPICGETPHGYSPSKILVAEARVLNLGPKFMSIYIHKLAIEREINYSEVEGLTVEWLETTSTLVLNLCANKRSQRRGSPSKCRKLEDVAWIISPCDLKPKQVVLENSTHEVGAAGATVSALEDPGLSDKLGTPNISEVDPPVFPLTVRLLSNIYVALHAVGGDDRSLDVGARLYMSSYLR